MSIFCWLNLPTASFKDHWNSSPASPTVFSPRTWWRVPMPMCWPGVLTSSPPCRSADGDFFFRVWIHVGWVWGQRNGEIHGELGGFDGMLLVNIAMENHPSSGWFAFVYQLFTYQKWRFSGSPCFLYRRVSIAKLLNEPSQSRDLTLTPKAWLGEASAAQCGRAAEREGQSPRAEVEDLDNMWTKWPVI